MNYIDPLFDISRLFPENFTEEQKAKAQTLFYKRLAMKAHAFYNGKMQTIPKAPIYGFNWLNVWYTPGVSAVSVAIRGDNDLSFALSNRKNLVAVVSDSTRVLGDGDCTPPGGLGVMEGKAMLMKYLGGVDAVALCIDSRGADGKPDAGKIIDFVKMAQPGFGAVNLEDISQPNCFKVLDTLRESCDIPVWHDDAQGTACVTLAGMINALKLAGKELRQAKIILFGAGAANSSIARLMIADGADPRNIILFDEHGALHAGREDYAKDPLFYRQWELCQITNKERVSTPEEAFRSADAVVGLSKPGPGTIRPEWISRMAGKAIVFACANPVPEIYPYQAREAGAYIVATGRGDFPNQINNSICFPSILKGTLLVSASKITDNMAIRAAHAIAEFAEKQGLTPDHIMPTMLDTELFPSVAAEVALQAIADGVSRRQISRKEAFEEARADIQGSQQLINHLQKEGFIPSFPPEIVENIAREVVESLGTPPA